MEQITVKKLYEDCREMIEKGFGDKLIAISNDNEGNGFHGMFYTFTDINESNEDDFISLISDSVTFDSDKLILLG